MLETLEEFLSEISEGEIHFRDNLQFELKSEFFIDPNVKENLYKQDFYLFVPNALQINENTYTKNQFYLDQTTLIRYKTPLFTLQELSQGKNPRSPFARLQQMMKDPEALADPIIFMDELKLYGNTFKVALRDQTRRLLEQLKEENVISENFQNDFLNFETNIRAARHAFLQFKDQFETEHKGLKEIQNCFLHTDEHISRSIDYYLTALLKILRDGEVKNTQQVDSHLCTLILQEEEHRKKWKMESESSKTSKYATESILYRDSLLNKYMMEALYLNTTRLSLEEKQKRLLGSVAAGVAMLVYMVLFIITWQNPFFVGNSLLFIMIVVVLYMLKDRIKEEIKSFYYSQATRWLPDYSTQIKTRKGRVIGELRENFSFVEKQQIPPEFMLIRNKEFHDELPDLTRQEAIMHYRREVILNGQTRAFGSRRREITTIFRLNIHSFLQKASNALEANFTLNKTNHYINERLLPKVYHINIIMSNTYQQPNSEPKTEIKKFRVVMDKFGIKRVEQIK